jgi:hypothetical protein
MRNLLFMILLKYAFFLFCLFVYFGAFSVSHFLQARNLQEMTSRNVDRFLEMGSCPEMEIKTIFWCSFFFGMVFF